jgi:hypothetical protein
MEQTTEESTKWSSLPLGGGDASDGGGRPLDGGGSGAAHRMEERRSAGWRQRRTAGIPPTLSVWRAANPKTLSCTRAKP